LTVEPIKSSSGIAEERYVIRVPVTLWETNPLKLKLNTLPTRYDGVPQCSLVREALIIRYIVIQQKTVSVKEVNTDLKSLKNMPPILKGKKRV